MLGPRGAGAGTRQECPYTLTLNYDRIVAGRGLEQKDLARVLAGRLVLVGGQFHASSDWVESPVHGQVPGVQYHAMALDNLVEDGLDYRRATTATFDSDLLKSLLLAALAFCGIMAVMARNSLVDHAVANHGHGRLHPKVYAPLYIALFTTSIGVVILATWLGVTFAHRSPINWIGISACALGFLFYATRQTLPADIIGSIEHLPLARRLIAAGNLWRAAMKFEEDRLFHRPIAPSGPPPALKQAPTSEKASVHAEI
jgi:CHASE2 domain-containing sensor protein